jgi:hypothetical protein
MHWFKDLRASSLGIVPTNWRWGRLRRRSPLRYSPRMRVRFWAQYGQRKKLQEKGRKKL